MVRQRPDVIGGTTAWSGDRFVVCSMLPAGRSTHTIHRGPYQDLHRAHVAIRDWCGSNGLVLAGPNWEIYGDWDDDPSKLATNVHYLLV